MTAEPVTASVHIDAPPERVYEYLTRPAALVTWLGDHAALDARPGGQFAVDMRGRAVRGQFLELDPPRRILISWGYADSAAIPPGATTVEFRLTADRGGTRVEVEHRGLPADEGPRHAAGWALYAGRLSASAALGPAGPGAGPGRP